MNERAIAGRGVYRRWVLATWAGWALGVPLIVAFALIGEALGAGGAQVFVGIGMGVGIGFMQHRALRGVVDGSPPWSWFWSSIVGLALPFLASDLGKAAGWVPSYSLFLCIALAGLIAGVWQALILRSRFRNAWWWVVGSVAGWTLASGLAAAADSVSRSRSLPGIGGALVYLGIVASGGLVLGLVTGLALVRMLREPRDA
jgi:hypothetical protein